MSGTGDWAMRVLDLEGVADKAAFMDRCAAALDLPDWFGRNWDALADALGDPGQLPQGAERLVLVVGGWREYARRAPEQWEIAQEIFEQADAVTVALALGALPDLP
ncbi:barstar family protein [Streptomyces sp. VRA16 Mangrove soil]|uniref:barstar family protein n=1 Tax=Streptomyces sp. VRA16 Mangrove soil TaxID=2817434 RepID=UPI001A9CDE32|nr:barstar family protein [Streptomyces sp. VRA16 Mangrove soil]MBO1331578.1 barstar family protein [Streptomyces sp. VRA16 Mangrove soil]